EFNGWVVVVEVVVEIYEEFKLFVSVPPCIFAVMLGVPFPDLKKSSVWLESLIITLGYKKPLEREDLFELNESDSPYTVCPNFEKHWRKELLKATKGLKVVMKAINFKTVYSFICRAMITLCENHSDLHWKGYGYAIALLVVVVLQTLVHQLYQRFNMLTSVKIKTAAVGLIYQKALSLANSSRRKYTTGEIVNLMSADAQQLMELTVNLNLLWSAPFQILMAIVFLWQELGPSVLAGVAVLVLVIPINAFVAAKVKHQMKNTDQRVKLLNEILHGIKILKLYAWEPSYQKKVVEIREHEIDVLKSSGYLTTFSMLTLTCIPFMVSLATFGVYFLLDEENVLTATKVFTSISLFNILRLPLFDLPTVISAVAQTKVSLGRLEDFLYSEDLDPQDIDTNYSGSKQGFVVVVIQLAYVSQQAWIQNSILQENILFGSGLNRPYYERVLEACALLPDLEQLPNGDQTEIGERGVNISVGQKQRVNLARAVYSNADLYLLDDPLSAVDVHVGKHLFEKLIGPSGLLKNKTRILVTHNLTFLPRTDVIIVMENGRITHMGTYQELLSERANFAELLQIFSAENKSEETPQMKTAYLGQNAVAIGQNLWLSTWSAEEEKNKDYTEWKHLRNNKLGVYGLLGFIQGLLVCYGAYVLTRGSLCASRTLHNHMLANVLHLPLQYFETNPVGQIINRFTKVKEKHDMFIIDLRFHYYLRTWLNCTLDVIGTILVIMSASPLFILVVIPLGYLYFIIQRYYIASSRQIRRLAGASHSPVISHFSETLLGLSTIRAFGHQERFIRQNKDVVNENLVCFYNNVISNRWLAVRLEFLGNLMVFFAALFAVLAGNTVNSSTVGLSISYALNITQTLNFWVRKACEIETNGVSIERVCEYEKMDKEAPWIMSKRPPMGWPNKGIIEFINYQARYRTDLGLALQDVSFQTHSKEKVGIVGRTGAGKSTLTNCLFRIIERAGGKIIIDGIDISTIGLHDLRGNLNIIPQDPVLFSGTLQSNLDPFGKYSDHELWEAVELCDLKNFVQSLPKKLLHEISEGGENLSVGQRQLVCLARALLRKTKILILDEATASVDMETDNLVQSTIRREFHNCTVLTIAHRLHTIMDSERVLVLGSGRIIEFDTPHNLLLQQGVFSKMVSEAGITQDTNNS
uniref:ABC-type glutathione-S-conjugate transporter n=1 Tax=Chrysemys picta bellii TaxID=8478 RepID=A0A8C3IZD3_CHRPI